MIRDRKAASDRQKSYANLKRKEIEFQVGDRVFLNVSPWKKVLRFGHKGNLNLRFIGPYEIVERIGPIAYRLVLPSDPSHVISPVDVEIQTDLTYREEPIRILAGEIK
ncbi:DNA/RNA polymerase superfamily protein [Gossypium australe]|uniref:DNA/RNA polymerase superfamily protein n=1 Tax=Gossypium australe TaxID=47621 RepID=A0A5B6VP11_9ROSI|nr:DNA/RNA polymerase superfamily protein [Gossypium australe]